MVFKQIYMLIVLVLEFRHLCDYGDIGWEKEAFVDLIADLRGQCEKVEGLRYIRHAEACVGGLWRFCVLSCAGHRRVVDSKRD